MNPHDIHEARWTAYALDQLDGPELEAVERELAASAEARQFIEEIRLLAGHVRQACQNDPLPAASTELQQTIVEELQNQESAGRTATRQQPSAESSHDPAHLPQDKEVAMSESHRTEPFDRAERRRRRRSHWATAAASFVAGGILVALLLPAVQPPRSSVKNPNRARKEAAPEHHNSAPRNAYPRMTPPLTGDAAGPGPYAPAGSGSVPPWPTTADNPMTGQFMFSPGVHSDAGLLGSIVVDEQNFDWRQGPAGPADIRSGQAWRGEGQRFQIESDSDSNLSGLGYGFGLAAEPYSPASPAQEIEKPLFAGGLGREDFSSFQAPLYKTNYTSGTTHIGYNTEYDKQAHPAASPTSTAVTSTASDRTVMLNRLSLTPGCTGKGLVCQNLGTPCYEYGSMKVGKEVATFTFSGRTTSLVDNTPTTDNSSAPNIHYAGHAIVWSRNLGLGESPGMNDRQQALLASLNAVEQSVATTSDNEPICYRASQEFIIDGQRIRVIDQRPGSPNTEHYAPIVENPFVTPFASPLSTFSIDVDTASYANVRRFLDQGQLPPPDAVRIEELINYFSYDYPRPEDGEPFSVNFELADCPWKSGHQLLRVGLAGREIPRDKRGPSNLVFLLDVSGSMADENKLPLVKQAMRLLVDRLTEDDRVAIVTYASDTAVRLESTNATNKKAIIEAIDALAAGGCTYGSGGIQLAYQQAIRHFLPEGNNRVILATDGDLNVGVTDDDELAKLIEEKAKSGVFLSVLGFGMGNLKDAKLEKLADRGNGHYAYVDNLREARKVLVEEMAGSLVTIAKDVKIQIEFNPARVAAYRLIGYENRKLAARDFNDDTKDAGEIGAGHTVTALYELVPAREPESPEDGSDGEPTLKYQKILRPTDSLTEAAANDELATVRLRYKEPEGQESRLLERTVGGTGVSFPSASSDFQFAAAVASFGMILRDSRYAGDATFAAVEQYAMPGLSHDPSGYRAEFVDLVRKARELTQTTSSPAVGTKRQWSPEQATGAPDTHQAGDIPTAWASLEPNGGIEWLQVEFDRAVNPAEIRIRESFNPGAVSKVVAVADDGSEQVLWRGQDPTSTAPTDFVVRPNGAAACKTIRVYLDTTRRAGWNEIDAVELIGADGSRQWASHATASSTYASRMTNPASPNGAEYPAR
ncbi:MAG: VWA domain-containing protein [Pirellulales bacterium]|nr:VWA domain-containing protein [Pirellulales bacterium]